MSLQVKRRVLRQSKVVVGLLPFRHHRLVTFSWSEVTTASIKVVMLLLLHGLLDGPRALPMATDKLGSFKNIL